MSPDHRVQLGAELLPLIGQPPRSDFVVRTLERRAADGLPLMSAEIVIASAATRERHALAGTYPLHFRKTYFPGSLHADPGREFERTQEAGRAIRVPLPIGFEPRVYRSCLVPGTPYRRISPFGLEPEASNLPIAESLALPAAIGLWQLASDAFSQLQTLHDAGWAHGDLQLHNLVVCPSPIELVIVDFEACTPLAPLEPAQRERACRADLRLLLREAAWLQVALGAQPGALGEHSRAQLAELFDDPERIGRAIERRPAH